MNLSNRVSFHTTLIVLASIASCTSSAPKALGQFDAGFGATPTDPALIEAQLRLRALDRELEMLFEKNITNGEEFDRVVTKIREQHEKMQALRKELQLNSKGDSPSNNKNVLPYNARLAAEQQKLNAMTAKLQAQSAKLNSEKEHMAAHTKTLQQELQKAHTELQKARVEMQMIKQSMATSGPKKKLPISVFQLKYAKAIEAAYAIENVLGNAVRVSVDERTNSLLVKSDEAQRDEIKEVLANLDQPTEKEKSQTEGVKGQDLPPAMMVRIFWLCDGQPSSDAPSADSILPKSVCDGLTKIGIGNPFLASQGTTTVALEDHDDRRMGRFQIEQIPSLLFGEHIGLSMEGSAIADGSEQLMLSVQFSGTKKEGNNYRNVNVFHGSVVMPLDHYVILGASSYATSAQQAFVGSRRGGFGGGEFGAAEAQKKPTVSQFAYVLQVVPAETFSTK